MNLRSLILVVSLAGLVQAKPPNIVLILSDDQSWTDYGFMGHPEIKTPHLDRLADESATFTRGYVPTALCRPALTSIATGLYAHQTFVTGNDPAPTEANKAHEGTDKKTAKEILISNIDRHGALPMWLAKEGYLSFQSGKWWEGNFKRGGFTHGMTRGYPERGGRHGDDGLAIGREGMKPVFDFIDMAVKEEKPFFVWYAPFLPHTPHNPPERLFAKYRREGLASTVARYYAMCDWFDETCGELLDGLESKGLSKDTLVIYVTDNGWVQSPKGNGYEPKSKRSAYDGGTRTPIMFRWPGVIQPGKRTDLCTSLDIAPTVLAAAGAQGGHEFEGLNLLPALRDGKGIERDAIFGESFAHDIADIKNPEASLMYRWVIDGDMKLLLSYDGAQGKTQYPPKDFRPQLFNLIQDPKEERNLAAEMPGEVARLAKMINDWYPVKERKTVVEWGPEPMVLKPVRPR
jgi:uncharacterized sulfatase